MTTRRQIFADLTWRHQPLRFAQLAGGSVLFAAATPLLLLATREIVDTVAGASSWSPRLLVFVIAAGFATGVRQAMAPVLECLQNTYVTGLRHQVQLRLMRALATVDLAYYDDRAFAEQAQLAQETVLWRPEKITVEAVAIAETAVQIVGTTAVLATAGVVPALLILLGATATALADVVLYRRRNDVEEARAVDVRRQTTYAAPLIDAHVAAEVRVGGMPGPLLEGWVEYARVSQRRMLRASKRTLPLAILASLTSGAAMVAAVTLLARSGGSPGDVAITLGGLIAIAAAVQGSVTRGGLLIQDLRLLEVPYNLFDLPPLLHRSASPAATAGGPTALSLRGVRFSYPGSEVAVLNGVDLELRAGEVVALIGANGAGKTTITRLLLRLYDPQMGSISLNGVDLRELDLDDLRGRIGVLDQDALQFKLTIRDNVGFGRASRAAEDAAVSVALDDVMAGPVVAGLGGLDSYVGRFWQGGHELSGGEWQRLALARHAFRDADIWILDEPTSALDPEAELAVIDGLRRRLDGRTALVVSHRMASVRTADRIAVLVDGVIDEYGTHDELMSHGGHYAELFEAQAASYR